MNNKYNLDLTIGSTVTLSDKSTIDESVKRGEGVKPVDFIVKSIIEIRENNNLAQWLFVELDGPEELKLIARCVDNEIDYRIMFEVEDIGICNRADMINNRNEWMFQEPDNPNNFDYDELNYTKEINLTSSDQNITYIQKGGELYGKEMKSNLFAAVIEYVASEGCSDPELLITEIGNDDEGGLITMYMGSFINRSEIEILTI